MTQLLLVLCVSAGMNLATIAALHDARTERDALHIALADSTLKRRALAEWRDDTRIRHQASTDLLRSCRDRLTLMDHRRSEELTRIAIYAAERYGLTWYQAGQLAEASNE